MRLASFCPALALSLASSLWAGAVRGSNPTDAAKPARPAARTDKNAPATALPVIALAGYKALLAKHQGKPLLVTFWATWCEPCRAEFPLINQMAREYMPLGLDVLGVNLDDEADRNVARDLLAEMKPVFPSYRKKTGNEDEFIAAVDPKWHGAIPATAFYDRDGHLMTLRVGLSDRAGLEKTIQELLQIPHK